MRRERSLTVTRLTPDPFSLRQTIVPIPSRAYSTSPHPFVFGVEDVQWRDCFLQHSGYHCIVMLVSECHYNPLFLLKEWMLITINMREREKKKRMTKSDIRQRKKDCATRIG